MSIATLQFSTVGARVFMPDGPLSNQTPGLLQAAPGTVLDGDREAEYVYLMLTVTGSLTLQQGQFLGWDHTYQAYLLTTAAARRGDSVGTFFVGGRVGDPGGLPSQFNWPFSFTFPTPGVYGIWVQRAGTSLGMITSGNVSAPANANLANTSTTAGSFDAPTTPLATSKLIQGLYLAPFSITFTGNTTNGSAIITAVSSNQGIEVGMGITGSNVPAGCFVAAMNGNTITLGNTLAAGSALATLSATGTTFTVSKYKFTANSTNGTPNLTNVSNISGIYPGSLITVSTVGMGVGTLVLQIQGNGPNWTLVMSANATSTTTSTAFDLTPIQIAGGMLAEVELRWPYIDKTN